MDALLEARTGSAQSIVDCWNRIGVHGDSSCGELQKHVHCRNCPVYGAAAPALLERDIPPARLDEWTQHFSAAREIVEPGAESIVIFRIGPEWLGLPTAAFSEIIDVRAIHPLPHRRGGVVLGVANVRGELLVCVSLAAVLGIDETAHTHTPRQGALYKRLAVIQEDAGRVVFPVDEVHGIHKFPSSRL